MAAEPSRSEVLVLGAGIAGIEASLVLASAGRTVHLVEKQSNIGGQIIKCEEVYPNMECATCMVSPMQQALLQHPEIHLLTLSDLLEVRGSEGGFQAKIRRRARYVDPDACIGCNACFEPCPVSVKNPFEEGLTECKAISIPCAGALPNVPAIDITLCLRARGDDCRLCQEACMFEAIDYEQQDEDLEIQVGSIVVATGFTQGDLSASEQFGYGRSPGIYSALEFERMISSNGPTEGAVVLRDGRPPASVAIIHCAGRDERGYCSAICCQNALKFVRYLRGKLQEVEIHEFHRDLCLPGKSAQRFYESARDLGVNLTRYRQIEVRPEDRGVTILASNGSGKPSPISVDMVLLASPMGPGPETAALASSLDLRLDEKGFFDPTGLEDRGIFITGCAAGPMDIPQSIASADAVAGRILSRFG